MIKRTTKKEIRRVKSLRKVTKSAPRGLYFVGHDNKAYVCDRTDMLGAKEVAKFQAVLKDRLTAQQELL